MAALAHQNNIRVVPIAGPSSILLALMASGLNGQNFAFIGYLPKERSGRDKKIRYLEKICRQNGQTQIFIETPYRSQNVFEDLLQLLSPETTLCLAVNLTMPEQFIATKTIEEWQRFSKNFRLKGKYVVFLIGWPA
jgi:16S rRNA (cytidine1402-2'-O)-methyltransferase